MVLRGPHKGVKSILHFYNHFSQIIDLNKNLKTSMRMASIMPIIDVGCPIEPIGGPGGISCAGSIPPRVLRKSVSLNSGFE